MIHAHDAYRIANNVNKNNCINRSMTVIDSIVKKCRKLRENRSHC